MRAGQFVCPTETRNAHKFVWFFFLVTKRYLPWIKDGVETASPSANHLAMPVDITLNSLTVLE